jgi:hypothetical protein
MILHTGISDYDLFIKIRHAKITLGGNASLRIYGALHCNSGKRMKKENRVFFQNETEAIFYGFRPCGHCMRTEYRQWKSEQEAG